LVRGIVESFGSIRSAYPDQISRFDRAEDPVGVVRTIGL
jgi:hypothetical protein